MTCLRSQVAHHRIHHPGEPNGVDPSFQVAGDMNIRVPFGASIPGKTTTVVNLVGNLSSDSVGPAAEVLSTNALDDHFDASPALVDGEIYLRGMKYLYSIGK